MPPKPILELDEVPTEVLFDQAAIRAVNPQRYEMEQLTAVTLVDAERRLIVGYKDVTADEFWVRGHMPDFPLLPGVLMCEAAAQLSAFYVRQVGLMHGDFVGFGGMNEVRFRGTVHPGQRLWLIGQPYRHDHRRMTFVIQGFVEEEMVFNGEIIGVPLSKTEIQS